MIGMYTKILILHGDHPVFPWGTNFVPQVLFMQFVVHSYMRFYVQLYSLRRNPSFVPYI